MYVFTTTRILHRQYKLTFLVEINSGEQEFRVFFQHVKSFIRFKNSCLSKIF